MPPFPSSLLLLFFLPLASGAPRLPSVFSTSYSTCPSAAAAPCHDFEWYVDLGAGKVKHVAFEPPVTDAVKWVKLYTFDTKAETGVLYTWREKANLVVPGSARSSSSHEDPNCTATTLQVADWAARTNSLLEWGGLPDAKFVGVDLACSKTTQANCTNWAISCNATSVESREFTLALGDPRVESDVGLPVSALFDYCDSPGPAQAWVNGDVSDFTLNVSAEAFKVPHFCLQAKG